MATYEPHLYSPYFVEWSTSNLILYCQVRPSLTLYLKVGSVCSDIYALKIDWRR